jgi:hypothetical protein
LRYLKAALVELSSHLTERDLKTLAHLYRPNVPLACHFHNPESADQYVMNGVALANSHQYQEAIKAFQGALKLDLKTMQRDGAKSSAAQSL